MGGQYEDTIEKSTSKKGKGAQVIDEPDDILAAPPRPASQSLTSGLQQLPPQTQSIRQHFDYKKTNKLHLHVDDEGLKVEIPPVQMEMLLSEIRGRQVTERTYYDPKNNTVARFIGGMNADGEFDIWVGVETAPQMDEGPVITKLDKLVTSTVKKKK